MELFPEIKLLDLSSYSSSQAKPNEWQYNGRYVSVIEPNKPFPYDEDGMVFYLRNTYLDKSDINLYLVTEDEEGQQRFLTFDNHNDSNFGINWTSRKNWRGVYSAPTYDESGIWLLNLSLKNYQKSPNLSLLQERQISKGMNWHISLVKTSIRL